MKTVPFTKLLLFSSLQRVCLAKTTTATTPTAFSSNYGTMSPMLQTNQIVANNTDQARILDQGALSSSAGGPPVSMIHVTPREESLSAFKFILDNQELLEKIEKVKFTTSNDPERTWATKEDKDSVVSEEYGNAIKDISKLPNLRAMHLQFSTRCGVERWSYPNTKEHVDFRLEVLDELFSALSEQPDSKLQSLFIENLQNINDKELTTSAKFKSVLSQLTELRLEIITEYFEHSPEEAWNVPEMYDFFAELPSIWLKPVSANVESLTLLGDEYWGYVPKSDLRQVHFPKLRRLELGNYTFSHDWQLDWILSHGDTLEELILNGCPIVSYSAGSGPIDEERYPVNPMDDSGEPYTWKYDQKWSFVFTQLKENLPKLRYFKFISADVHGDTLEKVGLTKLSYVAFHRGMGPEPWLYIDEYVDEIKDSFYPHDFMAVDRREEYRVDDDNAYLDLVNTVKCRAGGLGF